MCVICGPRRTAEGDSSGRQGGKIHAAAARRGLGGRSDRTRLGRVEQLVLRGDGLTTTSIEILTGRDIIVRVRRHWRLALPSEAEGVSDLLDTYTGTGLDPHAAYTTVGYQDLGGVPGDDVLVREVLLCDHDGVIYATARLFAALDRLPPVVAHQLATTDAPIPRSVRNAVTPLVCRPARFRRSGGHVSAELLFCRCRRPPPSRRQGARRGCGPCRRARGPVAGRSTGRRSSSRGWGVAGVDARCQCYVGVEGLHPVG